MSGPLPQYRTPSRPTEEITGWKHVLLPGGEYKNGRCVEYKITYVPVYRHVLAPRVDPVVVSKHAAGRQWALSTAQKRRRARQKARLAQIMKSQLLDRRAMIAGILDGAY